MSQLSLPLPAAAGSSEPDLDLKDKHEFNPDVYRLIWGTLLDCGELSLHQLRAVLDIRGARDLPIGGAIELAVERGDAMRLDTRLVATPISLGRRELLDTTTSIMLSDLGYRAYLQDAVDALEDRPAAVRRDLTGARYRYWDKRLFGRPLRPEQLHEDLEAVLLERPLSTFPVAEPEEWTPEIVDSPFLDSWDQEGIAICLPGYLRQLHGGVAKVNQLLRSERMSGEQAQAPSLASRPAVYHGGLLHPGEPLPRSVPDARSLRLRAVMHSPFVGLLTALLLLHRYRPDVLGLACTGGRWEVSYGGETIGEMLDILEAFCVDVGMVVCRSRTTGLRAGDLIDIAAGLGLCTCIGQLAILSEAFFAQLREDAEEIEVHMLLQPLMGALDEWLSSIEPPLNAELG